MKWFRFYTETVHKPKVRRLSPSLFRTWVFLLCIASEGKPRGRLPGIEDIADQLRKPVGRAQAEVEELQRCGLLDEADGHLAPHNWDNRQWDSDSRETEGRRKHDGVRRKRGAKWESAPRDGGASAAAEAETEQSRTETDTEQNRAEEEKLLPLLITHYENEIGSLTPIVEGELHEWAGKIPNEGIIQYAFKESSSNGARNWKYVASIFARLEAEGWPASPGGKGDEEADWLRRRYENAGRGSL